MGSGRGSRARCPLMGGELKNGDTRTSGLHDTYYEARKLNNPPN